MLRDTGLQVQPNQNPNPNPNPNPHPPANADPNLTPTPNQVQLLVKPAMVGMYLPYISPISPLYLPCRCSCS